MAGNRRRDYRAEEARRNARAREMGYSSRAALRNQRAKGHILAPHGPTGLPLFKQAGFDSEAEYRSAKGRAARWAANHSRVEATNPKGLSGAAFGNFYGAFVADFDHGNRMQYLHDYLVEDIDWVTEDEFDEKYT